MRITWKTGFSVLFAFYTVVFSCLSTWAFHLNRETVASVALASALVSLSGILTICLGIWRHHCDCPSCSQEGQS